MFRTRITTILLVVVIFSSISDAWLFGSSNDDDESAGRGEDEPNRKDDLDSTNSDDSDSVSVDRVSPPIPGSSRIIADDLESGETENDAGKSAGSDHVHPAPSRSGGGGADQDPEFDHRAILGSAEKAEQFHHLSPAEAKKRLWALTKLIDMDGNGEVTEEELQKWITQSLQSLNEEASLRRFHSHDQDGDGNLKWEEYLKSFYGYVPDPKTFVNNDHEDAAHFIKVFREDESKFRDADIDGDGVLTSLEFRAFTHPEDFDHMHANHIQRLLNDTDTNGDGAIDLDEFLKHGDDNGYSEDEAEEWRAIEADRFVRGLDHDSNSKLEGPEIAVWAVPNMTDVARDEALHLIYVADKNRDAVLSVEEILNEYDLFVGSAVTDYGQHLNDEL